MANLYKPISFVVALLLMKDSQAAYNQVANNIVRIDLTKQYIPHQEISEVDLSQELDEKV